MAVSVTIAHDFIEGYAGAERTLEQIARSYPSAPVWAIAGRRDIAARLGAGGRFQTVLPDSNLLLRHHRLLTPLYPAIVRARRLPAADVLISSSYAFANGFRTVNRAPQLCYCHTPARFAWSMTEQYGAELPGGRLSGPAVRGLAAMVRVVDRRRAAEVTRFVANSRFVARQIEAFYGRESTVVAPPVDTELFRPAPQPGHDGYFLFCGRLIEPYKRPGVLVDAFTQLEAPLVVAGVGPELEALRQRAPGNVSFVGHPPDEELVRLMQRCTALISPARDDFGLVQVEAMACGRPVIAFAAGGALETVLPGKTGELFETQSPEAIAAAVRTFDPDSYRPDVIRSHAERYGVERFRGRLHSEVLATARGERL